MKESKFLTVIVFVLAFAVAFLSEVANAKDTETLLINKLTNVFLKLPEGNPTKAKITLRLADLHAERGRLQSKQELEKGCIECTNGEADRKKALEYYQYVLPSLKGEQRQNVLVQVGHTYEVLGQNAKAIQFYKKVITGSTGRGMAEAQFSLAEIYFKQRSFNKAASFYQKALSNDSFTRRGLASYRLAWCQYNLGQIAKSVNGLEKILTSPKLLTRGGENLVNVDQDFKAEVAKDFTVFIAHSSQIDMAGIKKVFKYSPDASRIENVSFLAKELERLGRVNQSVQAWELVIKETSNPQIRMEGLVYLAGFKLKGSDRSQVLPFLKRAFRNWNSISQCKDPKQCEELKKRVRALVFDWNRMEKKTPSASLLEAYENYFTVATTDGEGFELASQAALQAKDFQKAYTWNLKAFGLAKDDEKRETLLLRRIEIAELSKNADWVLASQSTYLEKSPKQTRSSEIRYQMAQKSYDDKNYAEAATQFRTLALAPHTPAKLKVQSAELALDALVLTKDDVKIEDWAGEFAQSFPKLRKRFLGIAGASVLSQTAKLSSGTTDNLTAWNTLNRFDVSAADAQKKHTYYKNKVILARKLKKFSDMNTALRSFLSLKGLTPEDKKFGLENKVWLSELQLNFNEAYKAYKKLNTKNWLELARLADLAEKPSQSYYYSYLKNPKDKDLAFSICVKLIKEAKAIGRKQQVCVPYLQKDKNFFAGLVLEIYGQKKNTKQLTKMFKSYGLDKTPAAHVLTRSLLLDEGAKKLSQLSKHKLDGRTHRVAGSLKRRMSLITRFEKTIAKATDTQDWLTQTMFLTSLKTQYMRFFEELMSLPTPKGLTEQEQQEYLGLLSQQAAPYKEKADQIQFKIDELWKNEAAMDQVYADFHKAPRELQALLGPQIEKMKSVATVEQQARFDLVYKKAQVKKMPSFALLETARNQVKASPMNKTALRNLIQLETARGYQPMIIYLNSRLQMVDQGFETKEKAL